LLLEGQTTERYDAAAVVVGATNVSVHCHRCLVVADYYNLSKQIVW
jgi:hypothetical protein